MPSMPGLPLLDFTRLRACKQFSRSQTSSISCSLLLAGLSDMRFAVSVSDPSPGAIGASLRPSSPKASRSWLFCRLPLIESRRLLAASFRLGLRPPFPDWPICWLRLSAWRASRWGESDVCSSDLVILPLAAHRVAPPTCRFLPFGPSSTVPGLAYLLAPPFGLECLNSPADSMNYYEIGRAS